MRLLDVRAVAFGPLEERSLELGPGLNVVVGPNEAGKSSWHAAIFAGLCGVRRGRGGQRSEDREFALRHRPWGLDRWTVVVRLELDDGRRLEIHQDLGGEAESTVTDLITGRPAVEDLLRDGAPDGAVLLGLSRQTLPATLAVRQAEILRILESPTELQAQLQRAASTGGADDTAQAAIAAIKAFHLEQVGPQRRGSQRPLVLAQEALPRRLEELETARAEVAEYLALKERQLDAERQAAELDLELVAVRRERERRDLEGLRRRVGRARELADQFPDQKAPIPERLGVELTEVRLALRDFTSRPEVQPLPPGRTVAEIEARLSELPESPDAEVQPTPEVLRLKEAAEVARRSREAQHGAELQAGRKPKTGGAEAGELRRLAAALEEPESELDPDLEHRVAELRLAARRLARGGSERVLLGGGSVLALAGIALLTFDQKVAGLGAAILGIVLLAVGWRALNRKPVRLDELPALEARLAMQREAATRSDSARQGAEARATELGLRVEPSTLRRLAGELETFEVIARERESWQRRLERLQADEAAADEEFRTELHRRLEIEPEPSVATGELWERYVTECRQRAAQADAAERRPSLKRELDARRALESAVEADLAARAAAEEALVEIARRAGVEAGSDEEMVSALERWCEEREAARRRLQAARESWVKLEEILAGRRLSELEADLARAEGELAEGEPADGAPEFEGDPEELWAALRARSASVKSERDQLSGQVAARARGLTSVAEAEEAVSQAERELQRVEALDSMLARTLGFLAVARDQVQRDIAPRIAKAVGARLSGVTGGRYTEAAVDPASLEVRVRAVDGRWREARQLSHGTAEQVYLLLRLALAELLVTTGETAPIFLDDVTVQSDSHRTRAILELLHEVSRERQVVLFSQEDEVISWASESLEAPTDRFIELAATTTG